MISQENQSDFVLKTVDPNEDIDDGKPVKVYMLKKVWGDLNDEQKSNVLKDLQKLSVSKIPIRTDKNAELTLVEGAIKVEDGAVCQAPSSTGGWNQGPRIVYVISFDRKTIVAIQYLPEHSTGKDKIDYNNTKAYARDDDTKKLLLNLKENFPNVIDIQEKIEEVRLEAEKTANAIHKSDLKKYIKIADWFVEAKKFFDDVESSDPNQLKDLEELLQGCIIDDLKEKKIPVDLFLKSLPSVHKALKSEQPFIRFLKQSIEKMDLPNNPKLLALGLTCGNDDR